MFRYEGIGAGSSAAQSGNLSVSYATQERQHRQACPSPKGRATTPHAARNIVVLVLREALSQGAGSEASTRRALSLLGQVPPNPVVIDFGCGSEPARLVLARATGGHVTAVDIHEPFLEDRDAKPADLEPVEEQLNAFRQQQAQVC